MGCNGQKSSPIDIFDTRNKLASLYTEFLWILELIGILRRNYAKCSRFSVKGPVYFTAL